MNYYRLVVVVLFITTKTGSSLMCYECTTIFDEDGDCGEDFEPDGAEKTECDGDDICVIHVSPEIAEAPEIIQRGCIDRTYCDKTQEFNEHCLTCEEDLCNASPKIVSSLSLIVTIYFLVKNFL